MKRFWILVSILWLATCGGGGGSPTEPKEPAPVANFTATPTTLIQGQAVTFTSTSTGTITSYAWNVDDDPAIDGTTATYAHTYTEVGTYSVTLTVTGPGGSNPKTVADMITVSTAAPTPTTATSQTVQEDGSTTISLTATDPNGQAVTFAITTDPTNGTATLSGTEITYTPNANFYGTDSVAYTASNGTYTSDPVTITITVEGEDDEPTTNDVSASTDEDTPVTLTLDATEIDGDNYSFSIVSQPSNGTLGSINGNQVEYTPNQDFNGTDTFTFEATDDRTFRRNVATATITVNAINDAPVANDVTASMNENKIAGRYQPVTITLDATDVEGDALTYFKQSDPSNGTLGTITNNQVVYTPTQDFNGEDTFIYKATDGNADSNGATVTITVNAVNDAPVTTDQSASTDEDTAVDITLTATDVENDNLTYTIVSDVSNGTTALSGTTVTYTPTANFNGTDTFTFKANDGTSDSNTSTVTITVASVNDAPVANDVTASTQSRTGNMRQAVTITLDATDVEGDDLTISIVSDVSNGTTSLSGSTVTYTPTANYDGTDTFTYKANDGTVDSNIATGTITITDTNQAPIAEDATFTISEDRLLIETLSHIDLDGDGVTYSTVSGPSNGSISLTLSTGEFTYTPNTNFTGTDTFTYKVNDGTDDSNISTVNISVIDPFYELTAGVDYDFEQAIIHGNGSLYLGSAGLANIIKYDSSDLSQTATISLGSGESCRKMKVDSNGDIYCISNSKVLKISNDTLASTWSFSHVSTPLDFTIQSDGIVIVGWNSEGGTLHAEKIDFSDNSVWTQSFPGLTYTVISENKFAGVATLANGEIVIGANKHVMKVQSSSGSIFWNKDVYDLFGGLVVSIQENSSNNEIKVATQNYGSSDYGQHILSFDQNGNGQELLHINFSDTRSGADEFPANGNLTKDGDIYNAWLSGIGGAWKLDTVHLRKNNSTLTTINMPNYQSDYNIFDVDQKANTGYLNPVAVDSNGDIFYIFNTKTSGFTSDSSGESSFAVKIDSNGNILIP